MKPIHYVDRTLSQVLEAMAHCYPVLTVIGPRQSGKTTLVKKQFPDKSYVSLENIDERTFAQSDPRAFLKRYPNGAVIDEIQRVPELLSYLQQIVDESLENGLFILTGSHQFALIESITQSLAGRTAMLKLMPFSLEELLPYTPKLSFSERIFKGMYPRVYQQTITPTHYYRDYIQTYVERDVRKMMNIKDLNAFQQFIKLCAGRVGQIFSSHNLSHELGVSHHTIQGWLSVLEASFLVFRLPPYFENFGKRMIKSPKLYFTDVGLVCYLLDIQSPDQVLRDPLKGALVENFVILECFKNQYNLGVEPSFYFYRDSNQQAVDLLYKKGHELIPIEIKSAQTFHSHFLKSLRYFKKLLGPRCPTGYLVYAGDQTQKVQDFEVIHYLELRKILG